MQAKTGINTKVIIFASLIVVVLAGLALGGFLFPRTVVIEPTQVLSTVEKHTTVQKVVANFTHSGTLGGLDGTKGWGVSLGLRNASETVVVEVTSVHEVLVCLTKTAKTKLDEKYLRNLGFSGIETLVVALLIETEKIPQGTPFPLEAADCKQEQLLKTGKASFTIPSQGNYTLVIGKAAGYIVTSFKVDVTISETKEVIVTETITITTMTTRTL